MTLSGLMAKYCTKCSKEYDDHLEVCPVDRTPLVAPGDRDLSGEEIDGRYLVKRILGQGGMGTVYVAEQTMIGRDVGLKVLRRDLVQDTTSIKRFQTEAKAIARLRSSHTVTIYDFGVTPDGLLYYTMELLEGLPLSSLLKQSGAISLERAVDITLQALESLEEAHEHQILHRDLKPDNLFVSDHKGKDHVTILDFGIAKLVGDQSVETVTRTGMICGTPQYLAPEQALGNQATAASDLYSLGIVLYEMLAGQPPFRAETPMKVLLQHLNESPMPLSQANPSVQVPDGVHTFIARALAKQPEARFSSVTEFRDALNEAASGSGGTRPLPPLQQETTGARTVSSLAPADSTDIDPTGETAMVPTPASIESLAPAQPAPVPTVVSDAPKSRKGLMLGAVGTGVVLALILAIWQPWRSSPEEPVTEAPAGAVADVVEEPPEAAPAEPSRPARRTVAVVDVVETQPQDISTVDIVLADIAVPPDGKDSDSGQPIDMVETKPAPDVASPIGADAASSKTVAAPDIGSTPDAVLGADAMVADSVPQEVTTPAVSRDRRETRRHKDVRSHRRDDKTEPSKTPSEPVKKTGGLKFRGLDSSNDAEKKKTKKTDAEKSDSGGGLKFRSLDSSD